MYNETAFHVHQNPVVKIHIASVITYRMNIQSFNETDRVEIRMRIRFYWIITGVIELLSLVGGLIIGAISRGNFIEMFFYSFGIFSAATMFVMLFVFAGLYRDQKEEQKICGDFKIEKYVTSNRGGAYFFLRVTHDGKRKKIQVSKEVYDVVLPDELLYLEFAVHSNYPFQVRRNGLSLVKGKP